MSEDIGSRIRGFLRPAAILTAPRLSAVMALGFVSLSIPILVFILVFNYSRTSAAILGTLDDQVSKARLVTIADAGHAPALLSERELAPLREFLLAN